jgi:hypothetical protein
MKNPHVLFRIQVIFWLLVMVSALSQMSVTMFGKQIFLVTILSIVLLPVVEIVTWPAAELAPSRSWRNYFLVFRWAGWMFWIVCLFVLWVLVKI